METTIIAGAIGLVTTVVSWFLAKRKYNSEVDTTVIQNLQKALDVYKNISDDTKQRLAESCADNERIREDNARMREENALLKEEVRELKEENKDLRREVALLKDQLLKVTSTICLDLSCQLRTRDYAVVANSKLEEPKAKTKKQSKGD